nr:beta-propeller domain-containing protein [Propionicimonas sp.]
MNDRIFAEMAEQMRPDQAVLEDLRARLDADGAGEEQGPTPLAPRRSRFVPRARWWIGIAAALVAVALLVPAAGSLPGAGRPTGTVPVATDIAADYSGLYHAAVAAARRNGGRDVAAAVDSLSGSTWAGPLAVPASAGWATNAQVAGIDEGDIVKSDGSAIFLASGTKVAVLAADGAGTRELASIDTSAGEAGRPGVDGTVLQGPVVELGLYGTTLVVLVTEYRARTAALPREPQQTSAMVPFDAALTKALLYDVSDPANPRYLTSLGQSGALVTTRLAGDLLYLVTAYTLDSDSMDPDDPRTFVPVVTAGDAVQAMKVADCGVVPEATGPTYSVVGSIDLAGRTRVDTQSVLGGVGTVYMSESSLYLAVADYAPSAKQRAAASVPKKLTHAAVTQLTRIGIDAGRLELSAQGAVPGTVLNQFALDEYDARLRVVTTIEGRSGKRWVRRAGLFVLGPDLKRVGSIPSLVTGESVQSVRFAGPIGYVVTFRQVDPLFAIDLSDAAEPRVLSALKIPGFSTYLHQWSDTQLLGIGRSVSRKTTDGLKLSMFDTSDPLNVSETATLRIAGDDAEALTGHHAVLVDVADRLIGFAVVRYQGGKNQLAYQTFRYEDGTGFVRGKTLTLDAGTEWPVPSVRGLVIGDCLYVTSSRGVVDVYRTDSFDRVAKVSVKG